MKTLKLISVCKTDCDSTVTKMVEKNGKRVQVVCYHKVTRNGYGMWVEVETLPNGKKVSATKHGPLPKELRK